MKIFLKQIRNEFCKFCNGWVTKKDLSPGVMQVQIFLLMPSRIEPCGQIKCIP